MYRKPRFLEVLHEIREEMSREADYDALLFSEMVRTGRRPSHGPVRHIRGFRSAAPAAGDVAGTTGTTGASGRRGGARATEASDAADSPGPRPAKRANRRRASR
ncbi:MAG TPA: hypothetical protein VEY09_08070 [Pyrinomonadaceae bacterium]|nr:hypothetical protein [Pyrinomonadaceae bacterium]